MIQKSIKVSNKYGIHARPASAIVSVTSSLDAEVFIEKDGEKVSADSIMSLLMIAAEYGSSITIYAHGEEEEEALMAIVKLFEDKFGEE
jgi:phosphocarrier protein